MGLAEDLTIQLSTALARPVLKRWLKDNLMRAESAVGLLRTALLKLWASPRTSVRVKVVELTNEAEERAA
jgi:hypothetical protein